ncbi:flagellar assembly protein [Mariprofundus sp. EBB-1]|uniref:FliH/SctL family protein n=1 Tax=Mariprofundus sp. EBB-1 TaxID=2650971 RepID=UPI000EF21E04|nr:FliH/SctL family protein [Mariprofundus sp. EBB-1]RLL53030.1 flagellar assembly protein [Mariprofundus sp. EBB-1]
MSSLTPLTFPEDHRESTQSRSAFPFSPIDANLSTSPSLNTNRMQQLESMLKEVQGRAEIVEKEAYEKAYLAGEKAGMELGRKRGEQILESLQETLKETETSLVSIQQSFAEAAMDVAKHIAEAIVGETIKADQNSLLNIAKQASDQLPDNTGLRIAISPDDYSSFQRLLEDEGSMLALKRDATVKSGTCRVITNQQDILIDPIAAVGDYLNTLRPVLLDASAPDKDAQ